MAIITWLMCAIILGYGYAQAPVLDLFGGSQNTEMFFVPAGSAESFIQPIATNPDTEDLVASSLEDQLQAVIVELVGIPDEEDVGPESITVDTSVLPGDVVLVTGITARVYRYRLSGGGGGNSRSNYGLLLSTLTYESNLTLSAATLSPSRSINITAVDTEGAVSEPQLATINIIAANFDDPVFAEPSYTFVLIENSTPDTLVGTVTANDPDGVTYTVTPEDGIFSIDEITGNILVVDSSVLDFETVQSFALTVTATDQHPVSSRSSEVQVTVQLANINDPPVFTEAVYTFSVNEEFFGAYVGRVVAHDGDNDPLIYELITIGALDLGTVFNLNVDTGDINLIGELDFETQDSYVFGVQVTDGSFEYTDFVFVVVNVLDVADSRPNIEPTGKFIILDLNIEPTQVLLNTPDERTVMELTVSDDSAILLGGTAQILVSRREVRETFPNTYGACECTDPICVDIFDLCDTSFDFQLDLFDGGVVPSQSGPGIVPGLPFTVYSFNGENSINNNWIEISDSFKTSFLQRTDDFSLSMWVRVETASASAYLVAFENGLQRQFSLYWSTESPARFIFYYFRDELPLSPGDPPDQGDDAIDSEVTLSFFYDTDRLPNGLGDNQWHFLSLTIDFPVVTLTVDGFEYRPTLGNFQNRIDSTVNLIRDGTEYEMPAPILVKDPARIDAINGLIGGSQRGNTFSLFGEMRQITVSNIISPETYTCMASCNNTLLVDPSANVPHETFYNPVTRVFEFNGNFAVETYTALLRSLIYIDNGFLPPEGRGVEENRTILLQIRDEVDFGTPFFIDIIGRQTLVIDLNGDDVAGVGFSTVAVEENFEPNRILALASFIRDDDIDPRIEFVSVTFLNQQAPASEFLVLVDALPSVLNASLTPVQIIITAADPDRATSNVFVTALQSVRYVNRQDEPGEIPRQFEFVVSDGLRTATAISTITFQTFNDVPVIDLNGPGQPGFDNFVSYLEGSPATFIVPDLIIIDPDSSQFVEAVVEIEQVFDIGSELLILDASLLPAGVVCDPVSCFGPSITVSGSGAVFEYDNLLRSLQYINALPPDQFPNLFDRVVFVYVNDGELSSSITANVVIDIIPQGDRVILNLDSPIQNYSTIFTEVVGTPTPIPCHHVLRVVDASVFTFESVIIQIVPDRLPVDVQEDLEIILFTDLSDLTVSVEINTVLKRITFTEGSTVADYLDGIERIRYQNAEPEPFPTTRLVQFTVFPGGGALEDNAFCIIDIETINDNPPVCDPQFQSVDVSEDVEFPAGIHTLVATDADLGIDGQISYTLASGDETLFGVMDAEDSGVVVVLLQQPDFEEEQFHMIVVDACDSGDPQMCCNFSLRVTAVVQVILPMIVEGPRNVTYTLGGQVNVACQVTGNQLQFEWYRDDELLEEEILPVIVIPSVQPGNRGYYICVATNQAGTAWSYPGLLLLEGVRVYAASIRFPTRRKRQTDELQALALNLTGTALGDQIIIASATVDPERSTAAGATLLLTLLSRAEGGAYPDGGVTDALTDVVASTAGELGFTLLNITRQDGCPVDEDNSYDWPESDLTDVAVLSCPCGDLDTLLTINREATRVCGGSFSAGVDWMVPNIAACEFDEIAQELCQITTLNTVSRSEAIANVTTINIVVAFVSLDVSIASEILLDIIGDTALLSQTRDNVLTSIDQLLEADMSVIRQSQEESRATTKLLEGIQTLSDIVDLGSDNSETFIRNRFSLHIEEQLIDDFNGVVFNAFVSTETTVLTTSVTKDESLESSASLTIPQSVFEEISLQALLTSARFTYAVYNDDTLYQKPEENFQNFAVGSVIVAASLTEVTVRNLITPVMINFTKSEEAMENGTNATCAFWDPEMFDGFGGFSTDGCGMVKETEKDALCECDHLTSFALLLDISPQLSPPSLALEVITYIGLIVSIISLVVTILTYLSSPKLRKSEVGVMLVNMCFALLGVYIAFIISGQARPLPDAACGIFAAVLHYFMLAYFFWTAAEALFLYFKLVQVFSSATFTRKLLIASIVVCWACPVIIVAISLGGYQYYFNDVFCRPTSWPFWFGFVVPFVLIWIFNWIMFILIMASLCRHANKSSAKKSRRSVILRHLFIAMVLSLLFGLGWAFGLIGSAILPPAVHVPAQYIFSIFIGLQGVLIFILHAIRSSDAREEWKRWWYVLTCRAEKYRVIKATASYSQSKMKGTIGRSESYHSDSGTSRRVIDSGESSNFEKVALDTIEENPTELTKSEAITVTVVENVVVTGPTSQVLGEEQKKDLSPTAATTKM